MSLIDQIQMLNPFDLKPGIFRHSLESVIVIHKIDVVKGIVKLSKGHTNINNLVVDKAVFCYIFQEFIEVYATDLYDIFEHKDVDYLTMGQYRKLGNIYEATKED